MLGAGKVLRRGDEEYEAARRGPARHQRIPDRYPDVVVRAADEADVCEAVRWAATEGWKVAVRSGGHSFSVDPLRDGGMLIDLAALDELQVEADAMRATAGPARRGNELCTLLDDIGLFFPGGHCKGVGLGGYLLQGGYGWNSRALGVACESVTAVDVVTADGELVRADADHEPELYWAARGAGPGFFGVVTRFHLRLHRKAGEFGMRNTIYPIELLDELYTWARQICPEVDRRVEMQLLLGSDFELLGVNGPAILVSSAVFADSQEEALAATAIAETCPVKDRASVDLGYTPMRLADAYELVMLAYPPESRRGVDNMWTGAPADALLPGIRAIAETMPPSPSHFLWLNWGSGVERPDMAFSLEDEVYLALYGGWMDAGDDDRYADWAAGHMRAMAPLATGIQLADENLHERPAPFVSDGAMRRLDAARETYDPEGRFHSWGGRL
jgi:FAD/FMN-containing dehydrogenase